MTLMDLEIIILSKVRQRQISYNITYIQESEKKNDANELAKQKKTHIERKQSCGYQSGKAWAGRGP